MNSVDEDLHRQQLPSKLHADDNVTQSDHRIQQLMEMVAETSFMVST